MLRKLVITIFILNIFTFLSAKERFKVEHHFYTSSRVPFKLSSSSGSKTYKVSINDIPITELEITKRKKNYKSPGVQIGYLFMPKRWIAIGPSISWYKKHVENNYAVFSFLDNKYKDQNLSLKMDFRFYRLNRKYFDLYSTFSIGANYCVSKKTYRNKTTSNEEVSTAINYSVLGMSIGNRVYGMFELNGFLSGAIFGLGVKF